MRKQKVSKKNMCASDGVNVDICAHTGGCKCRYVRVGKYQNAKMCAYVPARGRGGGDGAVRALRLDICSDDHVNKKGGKRASKRPFSPFGRYRDRTDILLCGLYIARSCLRLEFTLIALSMAMTATPTSPNTASHIPANPTAESISMATLTMRENHMFS